MSVMPKPWLRKFSDNVCDNRPIDLRKRKHITATINEGVEERLWLLSTVRGVPLSQIIGTALAEYVGDDELAEELERAYRAWAKANP